MWFLLSDREGNVVDRRGWSTDAGSKPEDLGPLGIRIERLLTEGEHYRLEYKQELGGRRLMSLSLDSRCVCESIDDQYQLAIRDLAVVLVNRCPSLRSKSA
jgi:hypothetical protein